MDYGDDNQLNSAVPKLTNADLTSTTIDGSGVFDVLMRGYKVHLKEEFEKGRITGADYTKAYIELTAAAMQGGIQYLLARDQAYWSGINTKYQAIASKYQLDYMLPLQKLQIEAETERLRMETQRTGIQKDIDQYTLANLLPKALEKATKENLILDAQNKLTNEQIETQRSQTLDVRTDGVPITGSVGKQKDLYSQQITSYKRDAEVKAAKIFADAWTVQKTIDEGITPPPQFTNDIINKALAKLSFENEFI